MFPFMYLGLPVIMTAVISLGSIRILDATLRVFTEIGAVNAKYFPMLTIGVFLESLRILSTEALVSTMRMRGIWIV